MRSRSRSRAGLRRASAPSCRTASGVRPLQTRHVSRVQRRALAQQMPADSTERPPDCWDAVHPLSPRSLAENFIACRRTRSALSAIGGGSGAGCEDRGHRETNACRAVLDCRGLRVGQLGAIIIAGEGDACGTATVTQRAGRSCGGGGEGAAQQTGEDVSPQRRQRVDGRPRGSGGLLEWSRL